MKTRFLPGLSTGNLPVKGGIIADQNLPGLQLFVTHGSMFTSVPTLIL